MAIGQGPLRLRIAGDDSGGLIARALREGIVLAAPGEAADLIVDCSGNFAERAAEDSAGESGFGTKPSTREIAGDHAPSANARSIANAGSVDSLSPRELEVLEYLADGWSNAEIASALGIGTRTVRFHLENLYAALGVGRRTEAVREALRLGLVRMEF